MESPHDRNEASAPQKPKRLDLVTNPYSSIEEMEAIVKSLSAEDTKTLLFVDGDQEISRYVLLYMPYVPHVHVLCFFRSSLHRKFRSSRSMGAHITGVMSETSGKDAADFLLLFSTVHLNHVAEPTIKFSVVTRDKGFATAEARRCLRPSKRSFTELSSVLDVQNYLGLSTTFVKAPQTVQLKVDKPNRQHTAAFKSAHGDVDTKTEDASSDAGTPHEIVGQLFQIHRNPNITIKNKMLRVLDGRKYKNRVGRFNSWAGTVCYIIFDGKKTALSCQRSVKVFMSGGVE
eukprot:TRINITY_DN745_c0_g1_i3.p1 TRINITY_DN745_c0_g1~~TRINITY_DN745_c0_g1_i3.p1  ORF type:complete len:322 (-),score=26.34 TRINITY_DN745_c0_g1_i3:740-1603(-)